MAYWNFWKCENIFDTFYTGVAKFSEFFAAQKKFKFKIFDKYEEFSNCTIQFRKKRNTLITLILPQSELKAKMMSVSVIKLRWDTFLQHTEWLFVFGAKE